MRQQPPKPEANVDLEILVNSVVAAKSAANAAEAALRNYLKNRAGAPSGGTPSRAVPPTFMARATTMVHPTDTPEGDQNGGQDTAGDDRGDGQRREHGDGAQDDTGRDNPPREDTEGRHIQ